MFHSPEPSLLFQRRGGYLGGGRGASGPLRSSSSISYNSNILLFKTDIIDIFSVDWRCKMDIAALSIHAAQANLGQAAGIRVLKMAQDSATQQGQQLVQTMLQSAQPHLGGNVDIRV